MGKHSDAPGRALAAASAGRDEASAEELDLRGEVCPYTFLKARLALETVAPGALLRVVVDNPTSARDVPRALVTAGHAILACEAIGDGVWAILARRAPA